MSIRHPWRNPIPREHLTTSQARPRSSPAVRRLRRRNRRRRSRPVRQSACGISPPTAFRAAARQLRTRRQRRPVTGEVDVTDRARDRCSDRIGARPVQPTRRPREQRRESRETKPIWETDPADVRKVSTRTAWARSSARAIVPVMRAQAWSRTAVTSSTSRRSRGRKACRIRAGAYSTSKAGLIGLTQVGGRASDSRARASTSTASRLGFGRPRWPSS